EPAKSGECATWNSLGDLLFLELLRFPIKEQHERFVYSAQRICALVEAAGCEPLAVGTDSHRADAAVIDLLAAFVCVERLGVECAHQLTRGNFPLIENSHEVAAEQELTAGVKQNAVDMPFVTGKLANEFAVRDIPETDDRVVAAGCEERAIRTDFRGAD